MHYNSDSCRRFTCLNFAITLSILVAHLIFIGPAQASVADFPTPSGLSANVYIDAPYVQASYVSGAARIGTETFDLPYRSFNGFPCESTLAIGTIEAGSQCTTWTADPYFGGATNNDSSIRIPGGTHSNYAQTSSSGMTIQFTGTVKYVGFWWSAGSFGNQVSFYDQNDNVVAELNANQVYSLLAPDKKLSSLDGTQTYETNNYYGHPANPTVYTAGEPFTYIHVISAADVSIKKMRLYGSGDGFEFDNITTGNSQVQVDQRTVLVASLLSNGSQINYGSLFYSATTGGSITGDTSQTVAQGTDGTSVSAVASSGYAFTRWSDNSTQNPRTDTATGGNLSVTAQFAALRNLSYSASAGGSLTGSVSQTVPEGDSGTAVTPIAASGYAFTRWSDNSTQNPRADTAGIGDLSVTAQFAPLRSFNYSASIGGSITGIVSQTVAQGEDGSSVTAVASSGFTFTRWSDGSTQNPRTDTADSVDLTVTAIFEEIPSYTVTFERNLGSGTLTPQISAVETALKPNTFYRPDYFFTRWNTSPDGTGTPFTDGANYSFTSNVTLYAQWELITDLFAACSVTTTEIAGTEKMLVTFENTGTCYYEPPAGFTNFEGLVVGGGGGGGGDTAGGGGGGGVTEFELNGATGKFVINVGAGGGGGMGAANGSDGSGSFLVSGANVFAAAGGSAGHRCGYNGLYCSDGAGGAPGTNGGAGGTGGYRSWSHVAPTSGDNGFSSDITGENVIYAGGGGGGAGGDCALISNIGGNGGGGNGFICPSTNPIAGVNGLGGGGGGGGANGANGGNGIVYLVYTTENFPVINPFNVYENTFNRYTYRSSHEGITALNVNEDAIAWIPNTYDEDLRDLSTATEYVTYSWFLCDEPQSQSVVSHVSFSSLSAGCTDGHYSDLFSYADQSEVGKYTTLGVHAKNASGSTYTLQSRATANSSAIIFGAVARNSGGLVAGGTLETYVEDLLLGTYNPGSVNLDSEKLLSGFSPTGVSLSQSWYRCTSQLPTAFTISSSDYLDTDSLPANCSVLGSSTGAQTIAEADYGNYLVAAITATSTSSPTVSVMQLVSTYIPRPVTNNNGGGGGGGGTRERIISPSTTVIEIPQTVNEPVVVVQPETLPAQEPTTKTPERKITVTKSPTKTVINIAPKVVVQEPLISVGASNIAIRGVTQGQRIRVTVVGKNGLTQVVIPKNDTELSALVNKNAKATVKIEITPTSTPTLKKKAKIAINGAKKNQRVRVTVK